MSTVLNKLEDKKSAIEKANDPSSKHKAILDFGESLIISLEGFLFGEYKMLNKVDEKIERGLYNCAMRAPSLGVHWGFVRDLCKILPESRIAESFQKQNKHEKCGEALFYFKRLKESILNKEKSARIVENFLSTIEERYRGQKPNPISKTDFFNDVFISTRNIFAHPDQIIKKTGEQVHWPMSQEYFNFINPLLENALVEIVNNLTTLNNFSLGTIINEENLENKTVYTLRLPENIPLQEVKFELSNDNVIDTESNYFVSLDEGKVYVQNFQRVPEVNTEIAEKIVKDEKKKQVLPIIKSMIKECLTDDNEIDVNEFFTLKLTAQTGYMSNDELIELIRKERVNLGLSPEFKIIKKEDKEAGKITFNPWWYHYFNIRKFIPDNSIVDRNGTEDPNTKTFYHRLVFKEFQEYIEYLIDSEFGQDGECSWQVEINRWQQGRLTGYIWSRSYLNPSPISSAISIVIGCASSNPISIIMGEDRVRLEALLKFVDTEGKLIPKFSDLIMSLVEKNLDELKENRIKFGVIPKYFCENKNYIENFNSLNGFDLQRVITLDEYLKNREILSEKYYFIRLIPESLCMSNFNRPPQDTDRDIRIFINLFSVPIIQLTDYAIEHGLSLQKARELENHYKNHKTKKLKQLKDFVQDYILISEEGEKIITTENWDLIQQQANELGIRYNDIRAFKDKLIKQNIDIKDESYLNNFDDNVLEILDPVLDTVVVQLKEKYGKIRIYGEKITQRHTNLKQNARYSILHGFKNSVVELALGFRFRKNGIIEVIARFITNKKFDSVGQFFERFVALKYPEWRLLNEDGSERFVSFAGTPSAFGMEKQISISKKDLLSSEILLLKVEELMKSTTEITDGDEFKAVLDEFNIEKNSEEAICDSETNPQENNKK